MTAQPTPPSTVASINAMLKAMVETLDYLAGRWQDERQYEDINDYRKVIVEKLPAGFTLTKMTKRPFGFEFAVAGFDGRYAVRCLARKIEWKRIG